MDSNDTSLVTSLEKTDVISQSQESLEETDVTSQSQAILENKIDSENITEKITKENEESNELQHIKDTTEEVLDELSKTNKEMVLEKDSTLLNIETDKSLPSLKNSVKEDKPEDENLLVERDNADAKCGESNVTESSCEESIAVDTDKNTTELASNVLDSTEKCDNVEHSKDSTSSSETPNNDYSTSSNDDITNKSEVSKEKSKICDIPDESTISASDMQVIQKEVECSNDKTLDTDCSDSILANSDKDLSEKNIEPENTEFVQFSHDKHDDAQIEAQSMDAEDPFGGDISENIEQVETDNFAGSEVNFKNLYEQDNHLQDVINATVDDCTEKFNVECTSTTSKDINDKIADSNEKSNTVQNVIDSVQSTLMDNDLTADNVSKKEVGNTSVIETINEQAKKNIEEITPMETDVEQTDVLPGQDDELCIIPDSMKVIMPDKSVKTAEQNKSISEQDPKNEATQKCPSNVPDPKLDKNSSQDDPEIIVTKNKASNNENVIISENKQTSTKENQTTPTDIINIDDDSKNPEVEEITAEEICKQCGEAKVCRIRVKIGLENFTVCSKTCKTLFITANNKAIDIPSEGTNSKKEKRCAICLSIIEFNNERNLSWETMEFCNEECLGKFQKQYGSYCKNCNGSVQAVSLGKYCVRFGCDVRQFCCSTCLEEFKKGLKVCTYCQKDISISADGFLAPVGERGQFKDFCTQKCMEKYSKLNSMEPTHVMKKPCSVCQEV